MWPNVNLHYWCRSSCMWVSVLDWGQVAHVSDWWRYTFWIHKFVTDDAHRYVLTKFSVMAQAQQNPSKTTVASISGLKLRQLLSTGVLVPAIAVISPTRKVCKAPYSILSLYIGRVAPWLDSARGVGVTSCMTKRDFSVLSALSADRRLCLNSSSCRWHA